MSTQPIDNMLVSRELLERIAQPLVDADSRYEQFQALLTLRVMLREAPAAQPQGEPVANNREQFEAWVLGRAHPVYGWLDRHWLLRGDNPENYADPYVQGLWVASQPLYAEQPAPVVVK